MEQTAVPWDKSHLLSAFLSRSEFWTLYLHRPLFFGSGQLIFVQVPKWVTSAVWLDPKGRLINNYNWNTQRESFTGTTCPALYQSPCKVDRTSCLTAREWLSFGYNWLRSIQTASLLWMLCLISMLWSRRDSSVSFFWRTKENPETFTSSEVTVNSKITFKPSVSFYNEIMWWLKPVTGTL